MILDCEVQQALITKIKFKVNCENKQLDKLVIDFGPYPLHKDWLLKKKERKEGQVLLKRSLNKGRKDSKNIYLMPDSETDRTIGNKCLIIDYSKPKLNLNHSEQFSTPFCKNYRLE